MEQVPTQRSPHTLQQGRTSSGQSITDGHEFKSNPHVFDTMQQSQLDTSNTLYLSHLQDKLCLFISKISRYLPGLFCWKISVCLRQ